jgi:uncharacterized membrane-anchored protein
MKVRQLLVDGLAVFSVSFLVSSIVTVVWNLTVHKASTMDWETSFRFAILLAVIVPWITSRRINEK